MDEIGEAMNCLITRLLILNDVVGDRLSAGDHEFASELAEAGEWELAIETVRKGSRDRLLLTGNERQELDDIETSLRRLEPAMRWRSSRELIRGALRALLRGEKPPLPPRSNP